MQIIILKKKRDEVGRLKVNEMIFMFIWWTQKRGALMLVLLWYVLSNPDPNTFVVNRLLAKIQTDPIYPYVCFQSFLPWALLYSRCLPLCCLSCREHHTALQERWAL
jgi:hypothetical protein